MEKEWPEDALVRYRENAKHFFGYPYSTLQEYLRDQTEFQTWLTERNGDNSSNTRTANLLLTCSRDQIEEYIASLSSRGLRATTINRRIYSLNSFYIWAVHHKLLDISPLAGVRKKKIPRRLPKFLTFEDIQRLLTYTGSLRRTSVLLQGSVVDCLLEPRNR